MPFASARLEAPARGRSRAGAPELINLVLCIHELDSTGNSALLSDVEAYPLAAQQTIVIASDRRSAILQCDSLPATEALICWILGRADRIEILEPAWLRAEVGQRVNAMQQRYAA